MNFNPIYRDISLTKTELTLLRISPHNIDITYSEVDTFKWKSLDIYLTLFRQCAYKIDIF